MIRKLGHAYLVDRARSLGVVSMLRDQFADEPVVDVIDYGDHWLVITAKPVALRATKQNSGASAPTIGGRNEAAQTEHVPGDAALGV